MKLPFRTFTMKELALLQEAYESRHPEVDWYQNKQHLGLRFGNASEFIITDECLKILYFGGYFGDFFNSLKQITFEATNYYLSPPTIPKTFFTKNREDRIIFVWNFFTLIDQASLDHQKEILHYLLTCENNEIWNEINYILSCWLEKDEIEHSTQRGDLFEKVLNEIDHKNEFDQLSRGLIPFLANQHHTGKGTKKYMVLLNHLMSKSFIHQNNIAMKKRYCHSHYDIAFFSKWQLALWIDKISKVILEPQCKDEIDHNILTHIFNAFNQKKDNDPVTLPGIYGFTTYQEVKYNHSPNFFPQIPNGIQNVDKQAVLALFDGKFISHELQELRIHIINYLNSIQSIVKSNHSAYRVYLMTRVWIAIYTGAMTHALLAETLEKNRDLLQPIGIVIKNQSLQSFFAKVEQLYPCLGKLHDETTIRIKALQQNQIRDGHIEYFTARERNKRIVEDTLEMLHRSKEMESSKAVINPVVRSLAFYAPGKNNQSNTNMQEMKYPTAVYIKNNKWSSLF